MKVKQVAVIYMDFSKAFDKVPCGRLVKKVRRHGTEGNLADWISNWLSHRSGDAGVGLGWAQ